MQNLIQKLFSVNGENKIDRITFFKRGGPLVFLALSVPDFMPVFLNIGLLILFLYMFHVVAIKRGNSIGIPKYFVGSVVFIILGILSWDAISTSYGISINSILLEGAVIFSSLLFFILFIALLCVPAK